MELKDTIEMMTSPDYKERFKAEYYQIDTRLKGLKAMLVSWNNGALKFTPTCPIETYNLQVKAMQEYRDILVVRAKLEGIDLTEKYEIPV